MIALAVEHDVETRPCTKCGFPKPIEEFAFRLGKDEKPGQRRGTCRECNRATIRAISKAKRDAARAELEASRKICARCHEPRPVEEFGHCGATLDGRQSYCRPCKAKIDRLRESTEPRTCPGCDRFLTAHHFPLTDSGKRRARCTDCGPTRATSGTADNRRLPDQPTTAQPGTAEKVEVLEQRLEAGVVLFHPRDVAWPCHWPDVVRYCRELTPETERHGVAPRELRRNATG